MSWQYGWNAQSALLPQQKVEIKVGDKGNQKIKAAMLQLKQKNKNQSQTKGACYKPIINTQPKKNKGIQQRMKRDEQAHEMIRMKDDKSLSMIRQKLQKKQKLYKQSEINIKNHSQFLVDFVQKQLSKEDEQLQLLRKQFYQGRLKQVIEQQLKIHEAQDTTTGIHDYMRENLAWERQVLQQLNGQSIGMNGKPKVAQSFDRKLTQQQKQALNKVITQRLREKQRVQQMKSQRIQQQQQRIRKLKKLDILSDSEDEGENNKQKK